MTQSVDESALTDGDLTDTAVEGSWRDIVAATAELTVYDKSIEYTIFHLSKSLYTATMCLFFRAITVGAF